MSEPKDDTTVPSVHDIVLLPCPFCGSQDFDHPTREAPIYRLRHFGDCFIGVKDWRRESWFNPESEELTRWQTRLNSKLCK